MDWVECIRVGYQFGLAGNMLPLLVRVVDLAQNGALGRVEGVSEKVRRNALL